MALPTDRRIADWLERWAAAVERGLQSGDLDPQHNLTGHAASLRIAAKAVRAGDWKK